MANQTKTIKKTGGDYSTVQGWENAADVSSGFWKGVISDGAEYNETVVIQSPTGTPTSSNYVWLTSDPSVRHAGKAGTTHARIRGSTNGSHVLNIYTPYTRIDYLEIQQDSTGSSDEGIRVQSAATNVLIDSNIIWCDVSTANQNDGIYTGPWNVTALTISNNIIYGFNRNGYHFQHYDSGVTVTGSVNLDFNTFFDNGHADQDNSAAIRAISSNASDVINLNLYNNIFCKTVPSVGYEWADLIDGGGGGSTSPPDGDLNWNGSNNCYEVIALWSNDMTGNLVASSGVAATTKSSGSWIVFVNISAGTEDLHLLDAAAGNIPISAGVDRSSSEPDARQDLSLDIDGGTRASTPDIGADEFGEDGSPAPVAALGNYIDAGWTV